MTFLQVENGRMAIRQLAALTYSIYLVWRNIIHMKKGMLVFVGIVLVVITTGLFLLPGFKRRTDVCLQNFSVSEDGTVITIETILAGSMGYIRNMETEKTGNEIHCSFYCAFGGLNSGIGSKNRFKIKLDASTEKIYFDRGEKSDILVLERDAAADVWTQP